MTTMRWQEHAAATNNQTYNSMQDFKAIVKCFPERFTIKSTGYWFLRIFIYLYAVSILL